MLDRVANEVIAYGIGIPDSTPQQMLNAIGRGVPELFGHLPAVLALDRTEQSTHIVMSRMSGVRSSKSWSDPLCQGSKVLLPRLHLRQELLMVRKSEWFHTLFLPHPKAILQL